MTQPGGTNITEAVGNARPGTRDLVRLGAFAGGIAGALRIVSSFIAFEPDNLLLEAFYAIIDTGLLFGTFALYAHIADRTGWLGEVGFVVTATGIASIIGPDGQAFGVDMWMLSVAVISSGLVVLSIPMLSLAPAFRVAAGLWVSSCIILGAIIAGLVGGVGAVLAGVLFGAGYVSAAVGVLTRERGGARRLERVGAA